MFVHQFEPVFRSQGCGVASNKFMCQHSQGVLCRQPECCYFAAFRVGGGGPKSALLEAMVADYSLEERVSLAGPVPAEKAREFLVSCLDTKQANVQKIVWACLITLLADVCILVFAQQTNKRNKYRADPSLQVIYIA